MRSILRIPFTIISLLMLMSPLAMKVNALDPYLILYPSKGSVLDLVRIEYRAELNPTGGIWVYYDDILLERDLSANFGVPPVYGLDYDFHPPNMHPYNEGGFHNITLRVWSNELPGQVFIFNATFEVTEYVPCNEYLALNATYNELLTNYTALLENHTSLLINYSSLLSDFNALTSAYNDLNSSYSDLSNNYSILETAFNSLNSGYSSLQINYSLQLNNNAFLHTMFESLNMSYYDLAETNSQLQSGYSNLQGSYSELNTNYNALVNDLSNTRNTNYILAIATATLLATTVYFAVKKPKTKQEAK